MYESIINSTVNPHTSKKKIVKAIKVKINKKYVENNGHRYFPGSLILAVTFMAFSDRGQLPLSA